MTRYAQPISPRAVLPSLIHQAFADIENHSADHAATLWQLLAVTERQTRTPPSRNSAVRPGFIAELFRSHCGVFPGIIRGDRRRWLEMTGHSRFHCGSYSGVIAELFPG